MTEELVDYQERGSVAVITYDRNEKRNAWNVPMIRQTMAAIERANASDSVGAIVITNTGSVFCAGADFKAEPEPKDPVTGRRPTVATIGMAEDTSWLHLLARSKPSIMAVNGRAIGLGVTQTLAADLRMGSASSTYAFAFLERGTMPEFGCTALLPRLVGYGRAVDIILSARTLTAEEALQVGLISRISADDQLLDEAVELAERLAGFPALPMSLTREMLQTNATEGNLNRLLETERAAFVQMMNAARSGSGPSASTIRPTSSPKGD